MKKFDLEDRLVDFSVLIIELVDAMPKSKAGNQLAGQIVRSGTSVALNYGEAQSAESRKDFVHKMKIVLKELRETFVCLKIIEKANLTPKSTNLDHVKKEAHELISIFVKSVETAQKNSGKVK